MLFNNKITLSASNNSGTPSGNQIHIFKQTFFFGGGGGGEGGRRCVHVN